MQKPSLMAQELKFNGYETYTLALPRNIKTRDCEVYYHRQLIVNAVKLPRCTTGFVGPVYGNNKDISGARLLPMIVLTYPVDSVFFCHLLKTQHYYLCHNVR